MYSFARAAVTRYHNQSGLNNTNLLSPGLEAGVGRVVSSVAVRDSLSRPLSQLLVPAGICRWLSPCFFTSSSLCACLSLCPSFPFV